MFFRGGKCHRRKEETDLGQAPLSSNEASTPGEQFQPLSPGRRSAHERQWGVVSFLSQYSATRQ